MSHESGYDSNTILEKNISNTTLKKVIHIFETMKKCMRKYEEQNKEMKRERKRTYENNMVRP